LTQVRLILVGLGARSAIWRRVIGESLRARIVGLVDTNPARLAAALGAHPGSVGGATLAEVASRVAADAVILITPPAGRHDQIAAACAAGLAILAEKPLADSLSDARAHVDSAARAGVPLMVGLNFRYLAVTRALVDLFRDDLLGAPAFGRFTYERWRNGRLPHLNRYPLDMPQPMLWEQSIHHFDLMRHVYGREPVSISARTWNPPWSMYAGDANVAALITFAGGIEVTYQGTWAGNHNHLTFDWRTDCANGIAVQADMFGDLSYARRDDHGFTPVDLPPTEMWRDDAAALLADFLAHLIDDAPLHCSGADHLKSLRMVEACIASSSQGKNINPAELNDLAGPVSQTPPPPPTAKRTSQWPRQDIS
jgi:predicted dehydrogenase